MPVFVYVFLFFITSSTDLNSNFLLDSVNDLPAFKSNLCNRCVKKRVNAVIFLCEKNLMFKELSEIEGE